MNWIGYPYSTKLLRELLTSNSTKFGAISVVDGTQWELEVNFENMKPIKVYGSNKYPVYWDKFIKTVNTLGYHIS